MFMMASADSTTTVLLQKGKRSAANFIFSECKVDHDDVITPPHLSKLLDVILDPTKKIDNFENIDWCRWIIASGQTPDEFSKSVRQYDNATTCGKVWTVNFVAYRCRTCSISPCMSLCADCFQKNSWGQTIGEGVVHGFVVAESV
ncbi:unnamed protein product [Cyprideis torosa]|uniref:E3 ubiquitin-protein ligase n=1 Tax=Cyprideis torosa TaxID=163714 RepID=A0A7R8W2U5_9CRUS|nr:unnamed protein product [Cyprideis torosa]CAG0882317.1 unnamed protein product [Cyprideis torosa]